MIPIIKKYLVTALFASLFTSGYTVAVPDVQDTLPDIGTTAGATLSIGEEQLMGNYFVRQLRGNTPLIYDPGLSQYLNQLGHHLVANAHSIRMPFHFYLIQNDELNAFAFFGGNVVLHTGLFPFTDNESELASVLAHEISHITQRHLARAMEEQKRSAPLVWAGAIGSILLTMANPQAGMAALTGTLAGGQQNMISFTQSNEQEADRIGMRVLVNSGFDPNGMPNFMQKLLDQSRYFSRPPEILLTHPLPENRLADARNRAHQFPQHLVSSSQEFLLAKVRVMTMYKTLDPAILQEKLKQLARGNIREQNAARYGQAIAAYKQKKLDEAANLLQPLLAKEASNSWYLDLMTDIDIDRKQPGKAISRLQAASKGKKQNPVLLINLANAYLEGSRAADASKLLNRYVYDYPEDMNGWELLAKANAMQGLRSEELAARAENMALVGNLSQAIQLLSQASKLAKTGSLNQARYDARIDQFGQLEKRFQPIAKL